MAFLKSFDCGSEENFPDVGLCHLWQMTAPHSHLGPVIGWTVICPIIGHIKIVFMLLKLGLMVAELKKIW